MMMHVPYGLSSSAHPQKRKKKIPALATPSPTTPPPVPTPPCTLLLAVPSLPRRSGLLQSSYHQLHPASLPALTETQTNTIALKTAQTIAPKRRQRTRVPTNQPRKGDKGRESHPTAERQGQRDIDAHQVSGIRAEHASAKPSILQNKTR